MSVVVPRILASMLLIVAAEARAAGRGVSVDDLLSGKGESLSALIDRAWAKDTSARLAAAPVTTSPSGLRFDEASALGAMTFDQLVAKVSGKAPPEPAKAANVVTVTIPSEQDAEPQAELGRPKAIAPASKAVTLEIADSNGSLKFSPQSLVFARPGVSAKVILSGATFEGLSVFVRDQSVAAFDQQAMELTAKKKGVTEVYAVMRGKMYIVPVTVESGGNELDLKVPEALVSLDGVFSGTLGSALYPGLEQASGTPAGGARETDGPSLGESVAETAKTAEESAAEAQRYGTQPVDSSYKPITLQVIDDRSVPALGKIYPVSGAVVRLAGTEFAAKTDATGHLTIRDVPTNARFLVTIDDEGGVIHPGAAEVSSRLSQAGRVTRIRVARNFSFDAFTNLAGVGEQAGLGSYCATIVGDGEQGRGPLMGVAATVDAPAEGPFYFNKYGFLDRALHATGPDGRVCFYNIAPGPVALSFYEEGALVATLPGAAFAGRHVDEEVPLDGARLTVRLAAMGTAHEQLGSDQMAANGLKTIDMIDLIPLGTGEPMMQLAPGRVSLNNDMIPNKGRLTVFAQAAEFEPSVYAFSAGTTDGVTPLMPRGFIEDMSVYAQVSYNPDLGVVLAEFGHGNEQEPVSIKLVDVNGQPVGDAWYFSDQPVTKALFFNVPAGAYAVSAQTNDGFWLGADTVTVYNETVSYIRLGGQTRYRP